MPDSLANIARKTRIIFRADGNCQIGLGHLVRSLALASMLREEFECVFAIQEPDDVLKTQILETCHGIITLPVCTPEEERFNFELSAYISEEEILVLDGYTFDTAYQQSIKSRGAMLVCIDDIHSYTFAADVLINPAGGVAPDKYKTAPYTRLLLGPAYALLRPPFLQASKTTRSIPPGPLRLLLNMGGADPENHTLQIAKQLAGIEAVNQVVIVTGGAYKHKRTLENWLQDKPKYEHHQNLDAAQMCQLMQQCGAAITSASGVAYEYAAVGGALFVRQTASNQQGIYEFLTSKGVACKYETFSAYGQQTIAETFQQQLQVQRHFFDGYSDERLQIAFRRLGLGASLTLREATEEDLLLVYNWNNDPEVRRNSFNSEPIQLEDHTRWFRTRLVDAASKIYLAVVAGKPAAQIRFELKAEKATISYLIATPFRGKGLGHVVLLKSIKKLKGQHPEIQQVQGLVQAENAASVRAFEKAGFAYATPDARQPQAHRFVLPV